MKISLSILALVLLGSAAARPVIAQSYFFTSFDPIGSADTIALGINNAGVVAGEFNDPAGNYHGFLLQNGVSTQLDAPGSTNTYLTQPNNAGLVGVTAEFGPVIAKAGIYNSVTQTWTYQPDIPGANYNSGGAINDHGVTAGNYYDSSGVSHGWTWNGTAYTFFDYPNQGSLGTIVEVINNAGEAVGFADDSSGTHHGFLEAGGIVTSIDVPGAISTSGFGLNNNGVITGRYRDASDVAHGFLLQAGVYTTVDYPGADFTTVSGINDSGELTGWWEGADGVDHGFIAVATPEPGAIALFGSLGLTGVAFLRRKRARRGA